MKFKTDHVHWIKHSSEVTIVVVGRPNCVEWSVTSIYNLLRFETTSLFSLHFSVKFLIQAPVFVAVEEANV